MLPLFFFGMVVAYGQSFDTVEMRSANSAENWVSVGLLPDGNVRCRNTSLRRLIAAAYGRDENLVTGGPSWLDSERYDITAKAQPASKEKLQLMLQSFLAERFKLGVHHGRKTDPVFTLSVGKDGPKLQSSAATGKECSRADGPPTQLHLVCRGFTMSDLADLLPRVANAYVTFPVVDRTALTGTYEIKLDWMGKRQYDAANGSGNPLAVSIFDAVAKLGLALDKGENVTDTIVVDKAERVTVKAASAAALEPEQVANIDRYVTAEMQREHVPGLEVGIYQRGEILFAKGYGFANVELQVPVKPETIFQSGSVGKQFVSAAVMMLVEEGKVGLDDSIVKYFPDAPESWKPILIRNLLSHTSGLSEYETPDRTGPKGPFYMRLDYTEDELAKSMEVMPIENKPGEKWNYRNTNYALLGIMIHRVTGLFYADFLQERIFRPWDMNATRLISDRDIIPNRSSGYEMTGFKLQNQEWVSPTFNSTADGTLYFNVLDLAKWDEALYGSSLLKPSSLDRIWTVYPLNDGNPNPAHYGFGWSITAVNGHKVVEHSGAWQGFTCFIARFVDDGLTVVVLANLAGTRTGEIAHEVAPLVNPALRP
ncbi:MAG TPA: TIGR03435 family protein [Bryobacteraceae bacterium]|nr:TIGR03435 family protein [Bryobacteraceae bacterium]